MRSSLPLQPGETLLTVDGQSLQLRELAGRPDLRAVTYLEEGTGHGQQIGAVLRGASGWYEATEDGTRREPRDLAWVLSRMLEETVLADDYEQAFQAAADRFREHPDDAVTRERIKAWTAGNLSARLGLPCTAPAHLGADWFREGFQAYTGAEPRELYVLTDGDVDFERRHMTAEEYERRQAEAERATAGNVYWSKVHA